MEPSMPYLFATQLSYGYTVRELIHSHPLSNVASPSDKEFAKWVYDICINSGLNIPSLKFWFVLNQTYHNFDNEQ